MFICNECVEKSKLSPLGKSIWSMSVSHGPCESCETVTECGDISCQIDAYWDDDVEEQMKKMGY